MKVKNIDSKINVKRGIWRKIAGRLTFLGNVYSKVPFYLVNENTMDRISPPEKTYDEECLKKILKNNTEEIEKYHYEEEEGIKYLEKIWERIMECSKKVYVKLGVYLKNGVSFLNINEPSIFICPERIYNKKSPDIIFQNVAIHELTHAYINREYKNDYEKIIEESLANAIAFLHFNDEREDIIEFIKEQPIEYKGCYYWLGYNDEFFNLLYYILSSWKRNKFLNLLRGYIYYRYEWPFRWWPFYFFPFRTYSFKMMKEVYENFRKTKDITPFLKLISIDILKETI